MPYAFTTLGEAVISEVEAQQYLEKYLPLMMELSTRAKHWQSIPQYEQLTQLLLEHHNCIYTGILATMPVPWLRL